MQQVIDSLMFLETCRNDLIPVRKALNYSLHVLVILQILDGEETRRVLVPDVLVLLDQHLQTVYALLQFRSVIDVDVTGKMRV